MPIIKNSLRPALRWLQQKAAMNYTAGPGADNALSTAKLLAGLGYQITLGYWNTNHEDPSHVLDRNITAKTLLSDSNIPGYLSIKAPAFGDNNDLLRSLVETGNQHRIPLHFDSLKPEFADLIFASINTVHQASQNITGCTLPGRWQRSPADAEQAMALGLAVRVVKGQWPDPVKTDIDPVSGFMSVIEALSGHTQAVRVASHDPVLVTMALNHLLGTGTPCELEVLYGLPLQHVIPIARTLGVPVRIYVPFGHAWIPYCLSAIRKNPSVLWWLFKDALGGSYVRRIPRITSGAK